MHLQVDNVSKTFGAGRSSKLVLDGINFTVKAGEFVALVGSSGSGKSTIMRLVAGLDRPTAGEILVNGVPVRSWLRPGHGVSEIQPLPLALGGKERSLWYEAARTQRTRYP